MAKRTVGFYSQLWISHLPKNQKDTFSLLAALKDEHIGIFQAQSEFSGNFDLFEISGEGNNPKIKMLQTDKKFEFKTTIEQSKAGDFEFTLKIDGTVPRGPKVYHTLEDWEVGYVDQLKALVIKLVKKG